MTWYPGDNDLPTPRGVIAVRVFAFALLCVIAGAFGC